MELACVPVLSSGGAYNGYRDSAVSCLDPHTQAVTARYGLPPEHAAAGAVDSLGRIWVGLAGTDQRSGNRVLVMNPNGTTEAVLTSCSIPSAITMAPTADGERSPGATGSALADRAEAESPAAFVVCAGSGFDGAVERYDAVTLRRTAAISLTLAGDPYLPLAGAANAEWLVVSGMARGPDSAVRYSVVSVLDAQTLAVAWQSKLLAATDIWDILPDGEDFLLLNAASAEDELAGDVLQLAPGTGFTLTPLQVAPAPVWGTRAGDLLYLYHNGAWNSVAQTPQRQVSVYDLRRGSVQVTPLPDNWNAQDLALLDGEVLLSRWWADDGRQDGLYAVDLSTGALTLRANILGADKLPWER